MGTNHNSQLDYPNYDFKLTDLEVSKLNLESQIGGWSISKILALPDGLALLKDLRLMEWLDLDNRLLINLNANPIIPEGYWVESHRGLGIWTWNPNIILFQSPQQVSNFIIGTELMEETLNQPVLNANVLDFLLIHRNLIPGDWKGLRVFFPGTIYHDQQGKLYVRGIFYYQPQFAWVPLIEPIANGFFSDSVMALSITKLDQVFKTFRHHC